MELQEAIKNRRSIKKYLSIKIEQEKLAQILEAASLAPSAGNLQPWRFIVLTDDSKKDAVTKCCLDQAWMRLAPAHIIVCSETQRMEQFYGAKGSGSFTRDSCSAAIQNMLLTATGLGLGSCWVGAFNERTLKRELGIPDDQLIIAVITLGYPDEHPEAPPRQPMDAMVFFGGWGTKNLGGDPVLQGLKDKITEAKERLKNKVSK